jgi:hypothetical protein
VERVPDPAESASCHAIDVQSLVIDSHSGVVQRLLEILGLEKWILGKQGGIVRISRKEFEHAADGDPHRPDAGLPAALSRLNRNSIKQIYHRHVLSSDHPATMCIFEHRGQTVTCADRWAIGTLLRVCPHYYP